METIFQFSGLLVMPFWLLMVALPHWGWTKQVMQTVWPIVPAALLYAVLIIPMMADTTPLLMNPTLDGIAGLLATPTAATVAWVHFLAFDLFVGRWVYLDSRQVGVTAWLASPLLLLVLMFGPLGLVCYLGVRGSTKNRNRSRQQS